MVRHRFHMVFALGKFNEGVKWVRDMNEACRKVGCAEHGRVATSPPAQAYPPQAPTRLGRKCHAR
jgi:hypothetical protein